MSLPIWREDEVISLINLAGGLEDVIQKSTEGPRIRFSP